MHEQEPWVSVDEVAQHLGTAKDTVHRWIESKTQPAHPVGGLFKSRPSQVDAGIGAEGVRDDEGGKR